VPRRERPAAAVVVDRGVVVVGGPAAFVLDEHPVSAANPHAIATQRLPNRIGLAMSEPCPGQAIARN